MWIKSLLVRTTHGSISVVGGYSWVNVVPERPSRFESRRPLHWAGWVWDVISQRSLTPS